MKRKIKFRGKDAKGVWRKGYLVDEAVIREFDGKEYAVTPNTVGQFIEMYDKNGKEIYEGDILTFMPRSTHVPKFVKHCPFTGKYRLYTLNGVTKATLNSTVTEKEQEIIGNIYENLELVS